MGKIVGLAEVCALPDAIAIVVVVAVDDDKEILANPREANADPTKYNLLDRDPPMA